MILTATNKDGSGGERKKKNAVLKLSYIVKESLFRGGELVLDIQKRGERRFRNTEMLLLCSFRSDAGIRCN